MATMNRMKKRKLQLVSIASSINRIFNPLVFLRAEKAAFRAKMKGHYKGEFNMAALLRAKPPADDDEEDDD